MAEKYMVKVAENLNVMNTKIGKAIKEKDPKPIREMVENMVKSCNPDWIDINLGPARKGGDELMPWMVNIVQEVTDIPVWLDTINIAAIEAGLKVVKKPSVINSIMCRPERYNELLPICKKYNAGFVGLMWGPNGMARDANERAELTTELVSAAAEHGIPAEDMWIDPIITPVNIQQDQLMENLAFFEMLPDIMEAISPGHMCRSTNGLSNVSNGNPEHLRPILNRAYMCMLKRKGMYSTILDSFDPVIIDIADGKMPWYVDIVYGVMDGDPKYNDLSGFKKEEIEVIKTAKVILGHSLFSESWLDI